jgi:uncharacterized protein YqeY
MGIVDSINKDLISAVKNGDKVSVAVIRMLKSELKYKEIELGRDLTEDDCIAVLSSAAKKRRESIESFARGGRDDLVAREKAELEVVTRYMPEQMSDSQLEELIDNVISEVNASTSADIGPVMKNIMPKIMGRADGRKVNEMVRKKLGE